MTSVVLASFAQPEDEALVLQPWFEARTAHFNIYSCGDKTEVYKVGAQLEQFHDAYSLLAGSQAVTSPPIIVMAFPDFSSMQPFLPLYDGKPANLAGFFKRSSEENLIVLTLSDHGSTSLGTIFHEYTHFLMRRNDHVWPLWLQEGMAEIYSTFVASGHSVTIGRPIDHHLRLLARSELMPLDELMSVAHDSPQYNEASHQGVFYAESWLLTHFLMNGDNPVLKARFVRFTKLLLAGQPPQQAFTNALGLPLPAIQAELQRYLQRGQFDSIACVVRVDLSAPRAIANRPIGAAETCFRLGDELFRINRFDTAESYFLKSQKLAPGSPLSYEGLGLLAAERDQPAEAVRLLNESIQRGSESFLVQYVNGEERLRLTGDAQGRFKRVSPEPAAEIRAALEESIALMPDFGPAQQSLGFLELMQGDDLPAAQEHLERAIQLEPENQSYLVELAQVQMRRNEIEAALRTLAPLQQPNVDEKLRASAEEIRSEILRQTGGTH